MTEATDTDKQPLIFMVHVPKTAGSSINAALQLHAPHGLAHCETVIRNPPALAEAADRLDWMTGHVDLATAQTALQAATNRPIRYFACLREPREQVASHYNWLIEIFHKGPGFYAPHSANVKRISEQIRNTDNSSVDAICQNLLAYPGLFLNFQSRLVLGRGFNWNSGKIFTQLRCYEMLADHHRALDLVGRMLGRPVEGLVRENESPYHFDRTVFDHPRMLAFLEEHNALDEILYRVAPLVR
jgi:hypothetical protein